MKQSVYSTVSADWARDGWRERERERESKGKLFCRRALMIIVMMMVDQS